MTIQRQDILLFNGVQKVIISQPLEKYFKLNSRPNFISFNPEMSIRGYYADWKIEENKLFLIHFVGHQLASNHSQIVNDINDLFEDITPPIFADWFSGNIIIPIEEKVYSFLEPISNMYTKLSLENGQLISVSEISGEDLISHTNHL